MAEAPKSESHGEQKAADPALEEAKEKVRVLKARMAPQAEVRAAVEAYVALKTGTPLPPAEPAASEEPEVRVHVREPEAEEKPAEAPKKEPSAVEIAEEKVRAVKASGAAPEEVKAAVAEYLAAREAAGFPAPAHSAPVTLPTTLDEAGAYVRALKAKMAAQKEVKTAVDHFTFLKREAAIEAAAAKVRTVKANEQSSPDDVKAAVAAYVAVLNNEPAAPKVSAAVAAATPSEIKVPAPEATHHEGKDLSPEDAAAKVRALKASHAPQEEVKAVVAAYMSNKPVSRQAVKSPEVDAAAKVVQDLKARMASQDEVRQAVEAYMALKYPSAHTLEGAIDNVKALKAEMASPEEVKAAVDVYVALRDGKPVPSAASALVAAQAKVRALKAAKAPQAEVSAAVAEYTALKGAETPLEAAIRKVRELKASRASQEEVTGAVANYVALRDGKSTETKSETKSGSFTPLPSRIVQELAERVRAVKAQNASPAQVQEAVDAYTALSDAETKVNALKAQNAPQAEVEAAVAAFVALADAPINVCPEVRAAADHVHALKASRASKEQVQAAVDRLVSLEKAAQHVQSVKSRNAPENEVKAAVDAFLALCNSSPEATEAPVNIHLNSSS